MRSTLTLPMSFAVIVAASLFTAQQAAAGEGDYFRFESVPVSGDFPFAMGGADLDGDGDVDLVVLDWTLDTYTVYANQGDASYGVAGSGALGEAPISVTLADFNGDNDPDLLIGYSSAQDPSILLGGVGATFGAPASVTAPHAVTQLIAADFNNDGRLDIAATATDDDLAMTFLGDGGGGFGAAVTFPVGDAPVYLAAGDLNGDGDMDLVVSNSEDKSFSELLGAGDGTFTALPAQPLPYGPSDARQVAIADMDLDGVQDILITYQGQNPNTPPTNITGLLLIHFRGADGSVEDTLWRYAGQLTRTLLVVDYNHDGKPDVVTSSNGGVGRLRGVAIRNLMIPEPSLADFGSNTGVVVADLDGDTETDFAALHPVGLYLAVWLATSPDFNEDGVVDVSDLAIMLAGWGLSATDIDASGVTDTGDLASLLAVWGPCP